MTGLHPDSGAVGILPETLSVLFSKPMDRGSVRDWLFVTPAIEIADTRWTNNRLDLLLGAPLESLVTYAILLGAEVQDRRRNALGPWSAAFSTGSALDDGRVEGKVLGGRLKAAGVYVYAWPWDPAIPPAGAEPPPPIRMGQAGRDGAFSIDYLPRGLALKICALFDAGHDRRFDPQDDIWGSIEEPIVLDDTTRVRGGIEIYLVLEDEPGSIAGSAVDSSCVGRGVPLLRRLSREGDSLAVLLAGGPAAGPAAGPGGLTDTLLGFAPAARAPVDSLSIRDRLASLDSLRAFALLDSARCSSPVIIRLFEGDTSMAAEVRGQGSFTFREVVPGAHLLRAFRDANANGRPDPGEPAGSESLLVRPGRAIAERLLVLSP